MTSNNTNGSKAAQPAAKSAAAPSARQPPSSQQSAQSSAKPTAAAAKPVSADAAFRHFFTKLSTADIQRGAAATAAAAASAAVPAASGASVAAIPANALAVECYRQLHSSMPQLHAHHLDALRQWVSEHFSARILPSQMVEAASGDAAPFRLSTELLEAVRTQARLPPVHSRIAGSGSLAQVASARGAAGASTSTAAAAAAADPDDEEETPSFAEALAADAGKATAALSKRRGGPLAATAAATASSVSTAKGPTEVSVVAAAAPIDARMAAAASLYAVLLVHSLPLLVNPSAVTATVTPSPHAATPAHFLRSIPLSLAAEARREAEQRAAHLAAVVRFDFDDDDGDAPIQELDPEEEMLAYESDADDFIFTADPVPEDSDSDGDNEDGQSAGGGGGWGSLDSIPVEAHAIEQQVLRAQKISAAVGAGTGASELVDWASLQAKVVQLVSLWDAELFTLGAVFEEQRLEEHALALWRHCSRPNSRVFRAGVGGPGSGSEPGSVSGLEWLREQVLRLLLAQMLAHPHGGAVQRLLQPCVQELLQLPHLVPGMGGPSALAAGTGAGAGAEEDEDGARWTSLPQWDPERTLLTLLSQLCTATTAHPFPSNPSPPHSSPTAPSSSSEPAAAHLHSFLAHNLAWLCGRLARWSAAWAALLDSGRPLRFEPGLRERLEELYSLCNVLAFFVWNHPARAASAAVAGAGVGAGNDLGAQLIASGVLSHLVSLALMSDHALFHSHDACAHAQTVSGAAGAGAEAQAYCLSCRSYEQVRADAYVQVDASVGVDGIYRCEINPCASAFAAADAAAGAAQFLAPGSASVALPCAPAAPQSNPLHVVHQLLLLCTTYSPAVARHLLLHTRPAFVAFVHCPCYEEGHVLPALLFPLFISVHTRALGAAELSAPAAAVAAPTAAAAFAAPAAAAAPEVKKKGKEKKSKLVVAAIEANGDEQSSDAAASAAALDELGWAPSQASAASQLLLAPLRRSLFVVQQACAQLPTPDASGAVASPSSSSSSSSSSQSARPLSSSSLSVSLQLLVHVVQHVYLFASTSPQHKLLLTQLAAPGPGPASALSSYSGDRAEERAVLSQLVAALMRLRLQLPHVSNLLSTQLQQHNKPSAAAAALADDHGASPEQQSERLTALAAESDSVAGHEHRHVKQTLEQCHSAVQRLQQWLKTMGMEVAKKD